MTARYAVLVLLLGTVGALVLWMSRGRFEPEQLQGAAAGGSVAVAGTLAGLVLTAWGFEKGQTQFFGALLFGILGRLVVYGATLIYIALGTSLDLIATAVAMMGFHVVFMIVEIQFALRRLKAGKQLAGKQLAGKQRAGKQRQGA